MNATGGRVRSGTASLRSDGTILDATEGFGDLFRCEPGTVVGRGVSAFTYDAGVSAAVESVAAGGPEAEILDATFRRDDGTVFQGSTALVPGTGRADLTMVVHDRDRDTRLEDVLRSLYAIASDRRTTPVEKVEGMLDLGRLALDMPLAIVSRIEGADYEVRHARSPDGSIEKGARFELQGTYCRETMASDEPVAHHAIGESMGDHPCYVATGLESYVGVQVVRGTEPYGTLNFTSPDPRGTPFAAADLQIVRTIADWVSYQVVIEHELERLRSARERAEASDRSKSRFLANMSHEIRTPMTGVLGYADLLLSSDLDVSQRKAVERIRSSGRVLLGILNDILDLTKLESGRLEVVREPVDPVEVANECAALMRPASEGGGVPLRVVVADVHEGRGMLDPLRTRQILSNLLGNAVKFTREGEVVLTVSGGGTAPLRFAVRDTGIGIPNERIHDVFDDFVQADGTTQRRFGGTGLGLPISRGLAEAMGGTITITSEVGRGTVATLELPWIAAAGAPFPTAVPGSGVDSARTPLPGSSYSVLLAEDVEFNRDLLKALVESLGYEVDVAADGSEAIEAAGRRRYDAILMDVQMPNVDGHTATRRIRDIDGYGSVPIIALSAGAYEGEIDACLRAGMDGHVAKPATSDDLRRALTDALPPRADAPSPAPSPDPFPDFMPDAPPSARAALVGKFVDLSANAATSLRDALGTIDAGGDVGWALRETIRLSHGLRGAAGVIGATDVADAASRSEEAAAGGSLSSVAYEELAAALERVVEAA